MAPDRAPLPPGAGARVCVYTREGCHLCQDALSVVRDVCAELGQAWIAVDVDSDPLLRERYTDHVPVTIVDGRQVGLWFLDPAVLRAALR